MIRFTGSARVSTSDLALEAASTNRDGRLRL